MIYIASDHGGFKLKEHLKKTLGKKFQFTDLGPFKLDKNDDYPDYAKKVAGKVATDPRGTKGILACRSGQGVAQVANKYKRVRAAVAWDTREAKESRIDGNSNVLCLPGDRLSNAEGIAIVKAFLTTPFSKKSRHVRRLKKIDKIEDSLYRKKS